MFCFPRRAILQLAERDENLAAHSKRPQADRSASSITLMFLEGPVAVVEKVEGPGF